MCLATTIYCTPSETLNVTIACDCAIRVHGFRHLAREPAQYDFKLPMPRYCGGALLVTAANFAAVNGYSNGYWGWGGEDDDFCLRLMRQARRQRTPNDHGDIVIYCKAFTVPSDPIACRKHKRSASTPQSTIVL